MYTYSMQVLKNGMKTGNCRNYNIQGHGIPTKASPFTVSYKLCAGTQDNSFFLRGYSILA